MTAPRSVQDQAAATARASSARAQATPGQPGASPSTPRWRSTDLFGRAQEIEIEHGQAVYRLRLTALGKLILTK